MTAIFVGIAFIVFGVWGIINWFQAFIFFVEGVVPLSLLLGGLISMIAGIASVQARRGNEKSKN